MSTTAITAAKLQIDLTIEQDINVAMMRQPGLFAYYASVAATCERAVHRMETTIEVLSARLERRFRDEAAVSGIKTTESQLKSLVNTDRKIVELKLKLNEAEENLALSKAGAEAFRHRRDMLVQLAFNYREEDKGKMMVSGGGHAHANEVRHQRQQAMRDAIAATSPAKN